MNKNIYILPTDKPSIGFTSNDPFYTENCGGGGTKNQNIYITSDEKIRDIIPLCFKQYKKK